MSRLPHDDSPVKESVALVIRDPAAPDRVLLVQRPDDDEDLPGVWGLPAASLAAGETWREAAVRAGREKLNVALEIVGVVNRGTRQRATYTLSMQLVEARIARGSPDPAAGPVPPGSTRYQSWRWGRTDEVRPAAARGSLCSRLLLELSSDPAARTVHPSRGMEET